MTAKDQSAPARPKLPQSSAGRRALVLFAALAIAKAAGWILLAQAIAIALTPAAAGGGRDEVPSLSALLNPEFVAGSLIDSATVDTALWCALAGALLRAMAVWATDIAARRVALGEKERYRRQLLEHRLNQAHTQRVGDDAVLLSRGLDGLDDYYTSYWPAVLTAVVLPVVLIAWIGITDWLSALIIVLTLPLVPGFMILIGKHTEERVAEAAEGQARISQNLYELAGGLPVLVGLHRAGVHAAALRRVGQRYVQATMKTLRTAFLSAFALELIATLSVAVVAVVIGVRLVYGQLDLFPGVVVLVLAAEVYLPLREVGAAYHSSEDGLAALERVHEELAEHTPAPSNFSDGAPTRALVQLRGLTASWGNHQVFRETNFSVFAQQLSVLASHSGSGKSTLLKVITTQGQYSGLQVYAHRAHFPATVLYLSQHSVFTEATVAEELALYTGRAELSENALEQLLAPCAAAALAQRRIGELSPGEQRRVALARVLARAEQLARSKGDVGPEKADGGLLLVLDEPTAHLDPASATQVRASLAEWAHRHPNVGVLVASHDTALHALADVVFDINPAGRLLPRAAQSAGHDAALQASFVAAGAVAASSPKLVAATPSSPRDSNPTASNPTASNPTPSNPTASSTKPVCPAAPQAGTVWSAWRQLPVMQPRFLAGVAAAAGTVLAAAALAGLSGWLIVQASFQPPVLYLLAVIVGVRFFGIGRAVLRYTERLLTHRAILDWAGQLRLRLWHALANNIRFWPVLNRRGGALGILIAEVDALRDSLARVIVPVPAAWLVWALTTVFATAILPATAQVLIPLGVAGLLLIPALIVWADRRTQAQVSLHQNWLVTEAAQLLAGAEELRCNGLRETVLARFSATEAAHQQRVKRLAFFSGLGQGLVVAVTASGAIAALILCLHHGMEAPMAALVTFAVLALAEPFGQLVTACHEAAALGTHLKQVAPILEQDTAMAGDDAAQTAAAPAPEGETTPTGERVAAQQPTPAADSTPTEEPAAAEDPASVEEPVPAAGPRIVGVDVTDIRARYPGAERDVFTGVSTRIRPGQLTMITGESGSGKSTLLAVLLGFLQPTSGEYSLEAQNPGAAPVTIPIAPANTTQTQAAQKSSSPTSSSATNTTQAIDTAQRSQLLGRIAWCPQQAYLFNSTVRGNLLLAAGPKHQDDAALITALHDAGLAEWLAEQDEGLDTMIGAGGAHLSGGQRQRLALARALLAEADVLLLDEPTAHLGEDEGEELLADLRQLAENRCLAVVTHQVELVHSDDYHTHLSGGYPQQAR